MFCLLAKTLLAALVLTPGPACAIRRNLKEAKKAKEAKHEDARKKALWGPRDPGRAQSMARPSGSVRTLGEVAAPLETGFVSPAVWSAGRLKPRAAAWGKPGGSTQLVGGSLRVALARAPAKPATTPARPPPGKCPAVEPNRAYLVPTFVWQNSACFDSLPFKSRTRLVPVAPPPTSLPALKVALQARMKIYIYDGSYAVAPTTPQHLALCFSLFPGGFPMVFAASDTPICMLAKSSSGTVPVFWSEYNFARGVPNFVAYKQRGIGGSASVSRDWKTLPNFGDKAYATGAVSISAASHCSGSLADCACKEKVSSRGHMATLSDFSWDAKAAGATNTYINTVPSRQPFDGEAWNARERKNAKFARDRGEVFVVKGPSLESDGTIKGGVEVPTMFWAAIYHPSSRQGTAWTCRNGHQMPTGFNSTHGLPPPVGCFCADGLSYAQIEGAVGVRLFPGADAATRGPSLAGWS